MKDPTFILWIEFMTDILWGLPAMNPVNKLLHKPHSALSWWLRHLYPFQTHGEVMCLKLWQSCVHDHFSALKKYWENAENIHHIVSFPSWIVWENANWKNVCVHLNTWLTYIFQHMLKIPSCDDVCFLLWHLLDPHMHFFFLFFFFDCQLYFSSEKCWGFFLLSFSKVLWWYHGTVVVLDCKTMVFSYIIPAWKSDQNYLKLVAVFWNILTSH